MLWRGCFQRVNQLLEHQKKRRMDTKTSTNEGCCHEKLDKKKKVGNYLLGKIIGEGAFSKIRQGLHIIAREKVAVKIVPKKAVLLREFVKRGVRREAMLLQRLEHQNIVRLYEIMETENSYYLVLEYAEGGEFIKYLSHRGRLDEAESRKFLRQMAAAVDHMHSSNITHRDLKLENLLLDIDKNIKVIDFGVSNVFYGDSSLSTQCGSPVYAAPEMFCNRKYGPAVDIWSMGVCLYAMVTGKLPFVPEPTNNITMLHSLILQGAHIPDTLSDGSANLLARMLALEVYYRITIDEVLSHPWVQGEEGSLVTRKPPISNLCLSIPKPQIVNYMSTVFKFLEDDVFCSVIERKMNAVAATYNLLQRRFDAGIQIVGLSMAISSAKTNNRSCEGGKSWNSRVDFPLLPSENIGRHDNDPSSQKNMCKSYMQILKDSKRKSAQNVRSGNVFRQKEFALTRYKTKTDMIRHTHTKEEVDFLPDFLLTYTRCDDTYNHNRKPNQSFEWDQTCIGSKNEPSKIDSFKTIHGKQEIQTEDTKNRHIDGRITAEIPLLVPPTSPVSPVIPRDVSTNQNERVSEINGTSKRISNQENVIDILNNKCTLVDVSRDQSFNNTVAGANVEGTKSIVNDPCTTRTWSTFQKQKERLGRGVTLVNRKKHVAYNYGLTKPKALTNREARSYFEEIEQAKVIGQGRRLMERARTSSSCQIENSHSLLSRKPHTAGLHRVVPEPRKEPSAALRSTGVENGVTFRTVDANGIIHFPDVMQTSHATYDVRPLSPTRHSVEDGVTDVIRVHITSSAKY
ncbi:uncharacterized protein LOC128237508 isoform X1 [Mya arenaria]|uniref:uncharacterized protein LOC128237508 isoform X1 n=2 Tax=Mya arenaria TaxID=6604 RepID=UPI0022E2B05A|nr:uncharacterized protein LOC128237508 isoform X1 [Mya arenaria]